jgi:putative ABC transport system permease protein
VCVFLYGGNDGNNTVVPYDDYANYATGRPNGGNGAALAKGELVPITPSNLARKFGLHPPADSRAAVDRVMADFPNVTVRDQAQFRDEQARQIDQIINLFYSLLGLAILIALFGIVNTLGLSIFERIRELGLLRAVGATRRQLRSMIRWEAVIIAVLGAVLGLAIGVFFGWTIVRALNSQGITEFNLPVGQLVLFVVAAALAGILAAVLPGRRAARIDVLRAITTE